MGQTMRRRRAEQALATAAAALAVVAGASQDVEASPAQADQPDMTVDSKPTVPNEPTVVVVVEPIALPAPLTPSEAHALPATDGAESASQGQASPKTSGKQSPKGSHQPRP